MRPVLYVCLLLLAACSSSGLTAQQDCEARGGVYHEEREECFGAEQSASSPSSTAIATREPTATPRPTPEPTPEPAPAPMSWDDRLAAAENIAYEELFRNSDDHFDDDFIDFVGTFTGPYTYESVMGGEITVPRGTDLG